MTSFYFFVQSYLEKRLKVQNFQAVQNRRDIQNRQMFKKIVKGAKFQNFVKVQIVQNLVRVSGP